MTAPPPRDESQDPADAGEEEGPGEDLSGLAPLPPAAEVIHELVNTGEAMRLDMFLLEQVPGHTRAFFQRLIEEGQVTIEPSRRPAKPSIKVPTGVRVRLVIPPPRKIDLTPRDIPIPILFEDRNIAVIDKPAGLAVHPAPHQMTDTLVNALLYHLTDLSSIGGEERPGIVHRLDKDTSGVLLIAKNDFSHNALSTQFKERTIRKVYLALTRGELEAWEGHIELPLGKSYTNAKKQMVRMDGTGREASTDYRVLEKYRGYSLVEVYPHTGRTHQIRVHLASLRTPVACDCLYGREKRIYLSDLLERPREAGEIPLMTRQALHASSITFQHPLTREEMTFSAPLHPDMHALLKGIERHRSFR